MAINFTKVERNGDMITVWLHVEYPDFCKVSFDVPFHLNAAEGGEDGAMKVAGAAKHLLALVATMILQEIQGDS
ncbi:MAG: hypothetical protein HY794_13230 [Desulfarculus sp.]|nr:hypothetical protein [Desulfarculus sp.]